MVEQLFLAVPRGCLRFVIVVFPDHTHLIFLCVKKKLNPKDIKFHAQVIASSQVMHTEIYLLMKYVFMLLGKRPHGVLLCCLRISSSHHR